VVEAFMVTSGYDDRFGRNVLTREDIKEIFAQYQTRPSRMLLDHDAHAPSTAVILSTELRETDDGELGVFARIEVDSEEVGERLAVSVSVLKDAFVRHEGVGRPQLELSVDAYHFSEADLQAAAEELGTLFRVGGGRLYRFQEVPPPDVILVFAAEVLKAVPANVIANLITKALERFLPKRSSGERDRRMSEPSRFFVSRRVTRGDELEDTTAFAETDDPEMLRAFGEALPQLWAQRERGVYERDGEEWHRLDDD
jgi:hypothetical protein